jgi:hypothetical protein
MHEFVFAHGLTHHEVLHHIGLACGTGKSQILRVCNARGRENYQEKCGKLHSGPPLESGLEVSMPFTRQQESRNPKICHPCDRRIILSGPKGFRPSLLHAEAPRTLLNLDEK